jgi:ABC-type multidrug/protein/lipid transport system, ATPase component
MKTVWMKHIKDFCILMVFLFLDVLGDIVLALLFGQIIDKAGSRDLSAIFLLITETIIFTIVTVFIYWLYRVFTKKFIFLMIRDTKVKIFSDIQNLNITQFFNEDIGNKISLLTNDMAILEDDYFQSLILVIRAAILFILSITTIIIKSYQVGIFLLILTMFSIFLPKLFGKKLSSYKKDYSDAQAEYTSRISEYLNGFDTIKSFNMAETIKKAFFHNADTVVKKGIVYEKKYSSIRSISIFFGSLIFMGGYLFGAYLTAKGIITLGTMIICIQLSNHISNPIYTFVERFSSFKAVAGILKKIESQYSNLKEDENSLISHENLEKDITMKHVAFSYENKNIIENISQRFEKNKKYAIVGLSGSGKSTILKLLSGKIKPTSGNIEIDDINISNLSEKSILNLYSYISQSVFLFKGSVFDNITLYNDYPKEKVKDILKKVGLEKFIPEMDNPDFVGENGINLSGGEKQRISIARALIRETDILVADEILSNLDNETALKIERELLNLNEITLIAVTHRLFEETLTDFDKIIVINEGNIVETGTFKDLIDLKGLFYKIYNLSENSKIPSK